MTASTVNPLIVAQVEAKRRRSLIRPRWLVNLIVDRPRPGAKKSYRYRAYRRLARRLPNWATKFVTRQTSLLSIHLPEQARKPKLRQILLVSHLLDASGAPKIILDMAQVLIAQGYEVTVVSPLTGPFLEELTRAGAAVVIDEEALQPSRLVKRMANAAAVTICNTVITDTVVAAIGAVRPCYWYTHEVSQLSEKLENDPLYPAVLQAPLGIWSGGELSAQLIRPYRPDVVVFPYGVVPLPQPPRQPRASVHRLRIGVFGTIESRKGQDLAVQAIGLLPPEYRARIELKLYGRIVGYKAYVENLRAFISQVPETEYVGALDFDKYGSAMLDCDAVLVASRDDTLPLVSLDALGARRILLCTPTTGTAAYLQDGVNGFIAAAPTAAALAAMLSEAIDRREQWPDIAEAGRETFERFFSREAFAERLGAFVSEAVS